MLTFLGILGLTVGIVAGGIEIWRHLKTEVQPQILNPPHPSECGGRHLTITGRAPRRRRGTEYWIAIQPSDCRGAGVWWPQRRPLKIAKDGSWVLEGATLGREGSEGHDDIGKTFTIALFATRPDAHARFLKMADQGEQIKLPPGATQQHSIEVRRVRF